jgi:hypothetical protein
MLEVSDQRRNRQQSQEQSASYKSTHTSHPRENQRFSEIRLAWGLG